MRRFSRVLPLVLVTVCVLAVFLRVQMRSKDSPKVQSRGAQDRRPLRLQDIFIAVKTTGRFHDSRLSLLLDTWISRTKEHEAAVGVKTARGSTSDRKRKWNKTFIFTDTLDSNIRSRGFSIIVTGCSPEHSHQALSCKMAAEYDHFMASDREWLCHVDDDNYLIPKPLLDLLSLFDPDADIYIGKPSLDRPIRALELLEGNKTREVSFWFATGGAGFCLNRRLAERMSLWASGSRFEQTSTVIRLPDDCVMGFIVEKRLGVSMIHSNLFHSHLENLQLLTPGEISRQVTLSYGQFDGKMNTVNLKGAFSPEEDPSRFRTIHCLLYPLTSWCPPH